MTTSYPLAWPAGWPRTRSQDRRDGRKLWSHGKKPWTFNAARLALSDELDKHEASSVILSTNYELRLDGQPRAGAPTPKDVGIAVYFVRKGRQVVMARDAFDRAEENIRSLTLALEAMRAIERHGGALMMDRAFEGFAALGAPGKRSWRAVLGILDGTPVTKAVIESFYRDAARRAHPDAGGTNEQMAELNAARDAALKEIGNG